MFKTGDIVYHDFLLFSDGFIETKEEKCRPCIVLNSVEYNGLEFVVTVPCTTQVSTFNKFPHKYCLIPEEIFTRHYTFVRYENISIHLASQTYLIHRIVSEETVNRIIDGFLNSNPKQSEVYQLLLKGKQEKEALNRLEKHERKMLRKLRRKQICFSREDD